MGGGGGVYSDLEICTISSLLHLNQLWGGGACLPCSLLSIRQWLMNSDQLVIKYTSNNSHIPSLMLVIVVLDKTEQDLVIYVHLFTRIS